MGISSIKRLAHWAYRKAGVPYLAPLLWAEQRTQKGPVNERVAEYGFALRELCKPGGIERVLDVGSGDKAWPALLSDCGYKVTAIDKSATTNRHHLVSRMDITNPEWLAWDWDAITCISVLEHIEQFELAVQHMSWRLRDGGHLIVTFPCTDREYRRDVWYGSRPYITQSFRLGQVLDWQRYYLLRLVRAKYYIGYQGEYWGEGGRVTPPLDARSTDEMNLGLFHFLKLEA